MKKTELQWWQRRATTALADDESLVAKLDYNTDTITDTKGDPQFGVLYKTVDNPIDLDCDLEDELEGTLGLIRSDDKSLVIALDTEYHTLKGTLEREIITWQFCFAHPLDASKLVQVIFYSMTGKRLRLNKALSYMIEKFNLAEEMRTLKATKCPKRGYKYEETKEWKLPTYNTYGRLWRDKWQRKDEWIACKSFVAALEASDKDPDFFAAYETLSQTSRPSAHKLKVDPQTGYELELAGYINNTDQFHVKEKFIPVTLLCHAGKADLSTFDDVPLDEDDVLRMCSEVQGGLVTINNYRANCRSCVNSKRFYPCNITVRDTMCHAPDKMKKLEDLGKAIDVPKAKLPACYSKDNMLDFLKYDPVDFMEYASQDAVVTLCYAGSLYQFNCEMPVTASSAAAKVMKDEICSDLGIEPKDFDRHFTGSVKTQEGLDYDKKAHQMKPLYKKDFVSDGACMINELARNTYKGGLNGCSSVGWIDYLTYDLDLCSAYPTAMCCVYDIDFTAKDPIAKQWQNEYAELDDFDTPFDPAYFYVDEFEFPKSVKYPSIVVNVDGRLFTPRTLGQQAGVYCTGPEVCLALKLGAKVHISRGYKGVIRRDADGNPTRTLGHGVKAFVEDRLLLKEKIKNGEEKYKVLEQLMKMMVNSIYGKTAQNIIEKTTYDAFYCSMVDLGASCITSPCHAAITTAAVRCILIAAMNELDKQGYKSLSYTTDGFITDAPAKVTNKLELYGMAEYLKEARVFLSGDNTLWECKHQQDEFFNATTRGNVAPHPGGVLAHNSFVSPYDPRVNEQADRDFCLDVWLRRTGKCECKQNIWSRFKDMTDPEEAEDFMVRQQVRAISMDFDMKRQPVKASIVTKHPVLNGVTYEVANFETKPYDTPEEEVWYHSRLKNRQDRNKALRTEKDLREFFASVQQATVEEQQQRRVTDLEWSKLFTCIMGHRLGIWEIPALEYLQENGETIPEICEYINAFNDSKRVFKESDWKNARKQNRSHQMLKLADVKDKLEEMGLYVGLDENGCTIIKEEEGWEQYLGVYATNEVEAQMYMLGVWYEL